MVARVKRVRRASNLSPARKTIDDSTRRRISLKLPGITSSFYYFIAKSFQCIFHASRSDICSGDQASLIPYTAFASWCKSVSHRIDSWAPLVGRSKLRILAVKWSLYTTHRRTVNTGGLTAVSTIKATFSRVVSAFTVTPPVSDPFSKVNLAVREVGEGGLGRWSRRLRRILAVERSIYVRTQKQHQRRCQRSSLHHPSHTRPCCTRLHCHTSRLRPIQGCQPGSPGSMARGDSVGGVVGCVGSWQLKGAFTPHSEAPSSQVPTQQSPPS